MEIKRIGSIGIGGISRGVHLPGLEASPDLSLTAVCDVNPEALRFAGERYGIDQSHLFSDYRQLIACPDVDAVDISTPNNLHFEIAMAAVAAGKPYCLEKPVTLSADQAAVLADATQRAGLPSMVCFSYRYRPAARYARELVRSGMIGKIYHIDLQYQQSWGLPYVNRSRVWRFSAEQAGSGALGDLGSHALDLARFVTGKEYARVCGHLGTFTHERPALDGSAMAPVDVDDFSNYMAEMEDGIAATFRISRFAFGRGNYQTMEIYGSEGALVYTLDRDGQGRDELWACSGRVNGASCRFTQLDVPDRFRADQMQSFADMLFGHPDEMTATIADGLANQRAVDAVLESSRTGRWVSLSV